MTVEFLIQSPLPNENLHGVFDVIHTVDKSLLRAKLREMQYREFLETRYWKAVALVVKSKDGNKCRVCNRTVSLNAHHREYPTRGSEHENLHCLTTLCASCHGLFHSAEEAQCSVTLTKELINACRTDKGGFTIATAMSLHTPDMEKGWVQRLIGKRIFVDDYKIAVASSEIKSAKWANRFDVWPQIYVKSPIGFGV